MAIDPPSGVTAPGTQPQHYGEQVMIPKAIYPLFMKTMQEHLENLEENKAAKHMEMARRHANDPNKYQHHFLAGLRYQRVANYKDINDMIQNKLTDSGLSNVDKQIASLKQGNQLKTPEGMQKYRQLQMERNRRKQVLLDSETKAYNNYLTNPFTLMNERPKTLPENYAQKELSGFLRKHRGVIEPNDKGHLIIDGKTVSTDPQDASKLVHYLTKDIKGKPPKGVKELLQAMSKRGFDYKNNLGNAYLKQMLDENNKQKALESALKKGYNQGTTSSSSSKIKKDAVKKKLNVLQRVKQEKEMMLRKNKKERLAEKKKKLLETARQKRQEQEEAEAAERKEQEKKSKKTKKVTTGAAKKKIQTRSLTKKNV